MLFRTIFSYSNAGTLTVGSVACHSTYPENLSFILKLQLNVGVKTLLIVYDSYTATSAIC